MFQVFKRFCATCICHRNWAVLGEELDELVVHALLLAFDIGRVNQEFITALGEVFERFLVDFDIDNRLPAVGGNLPLRLAIDHAGALAAQVQNQVFLADGLYKFVEARSVEFSIRENPARHNYMRCAGLDVLQCVLGINATANLQAPLDTPKARPLPRSRFPCQA